MVSRIVFLLLATVVGAGAAIDFTPVLTEVHFEGGGVKLPTFVNGVAKVTFSPPGGWTFEGAGPVLKLAPKEAMSFARIETKPLVADTVTSEATLKSCMQELAGTLPRDAQGVQWSPVEQNPVLLNQHETARVEVTYKTANQTFRASLLVCNLADQQLRFVVSARDRDFPAVYEDFRRSIYTLQGLK